MCWNIWRFWFSSIIYLHRWMKRLRPEILRGNLPHTFSILTHFHVWFFFHIRTLFEGIKVDYVVQWIIIKIDKQTIYITLSTLKFQKFMNYFFNYLSFFPLFIPNGLFHNLVHWIRWICESTLSTISHGFLRCNLIYIKCLRKIQKELATNLYFEGFSSAWSVRGKFQNHLYLVITTHLARYFVKKQTFTDLITSPTKISTFLKGLLQF